MIQSGIEEKNKDLVIDEIGNQLKSLCGGDFTENDIENSKKSLADSINSVNDSPEDIDIWYCSNIFEDNPLSPSEFADEIYKVTKEKICNVAKTLKLDTVYMLTGTEAENDEN